MNKEEKLADYALDPKKRKSELGGKFRKYGTDRPEDEFRSEYRRDRDRIIWSTAFRRMQNKTQVFAHDEDDHFRRRLTHSIEVADIACSIARRLNLNEEATDAIAMGHDIGHPPFGHAGEDALNEVSKEYVLPRDVNQPVPIIGFDHCAHAIEVISRIETLNGTNPGLGLTLDVEDGILKHIYHKDNETRTESEIKDKPFSALSEIVKCERYKDYGCNYGSLEAQCLWIADKLTYLFEDVEDAIRAKIFRFDIKDPNSNIVRCAKESNLHKALDKVLKTSYSNMNMSELCERAESIQKYYPNDEIRPFHFWRNKAMTAIIYNCVENTKKRIKERGISSVEGVFKCPERLVDVSEDLADAWRGTKYNKNNFYDKAMKSILFKHRIVLRHTYNAKQKIRRLFEVYISKDGYDLIPADYKDIAEKNYDFCKDIKATHVKDGKEIDVIKIITVRNYIAGMTDAYINRMLQEYIT